MMSWSHPTTLTGRWRVPDSVFRGLAVSIIVLTGGFLLVVYPWLPSTIPQHFSFSGVVDATTAKSWWSVFWPIILQAVLTTLLWWVSYHPEYSNLPTSLPIRALPEPTQTIIRRMLAHLMVMTSVLVNLLFAYVSLAIVSVALGQSTRMSGWLILGLTLAILALSIGYAVWISRLIPRRPLPEEKAPDRVSGA